MIPPVDVILTAVHRANMNRQKRMPHWILLTLASAMLLAGCTGLRAARVDSLYLHVFDARPAGDILGIVAPGSVMFDFAAARLRWRVG